jgi:hypothetical protein
MDSDSLNGEGVNTPDTLLAQALADLLKSAWLAAALLMMLISRGWLYCVLSAGAGGPAEGDAPRLLHPAAPREEPRRGAARQPGTLCITP